MARTSALLHNSLGFPWLRHCLNINCQLLYFSCLFAIQATQIKAETQQNLEDEMQKMQQKFKVREDKAKKQHREEMGQVQIFSQA